MFEANQAVGEVVAREPACAQVFFSHRIDYCCQGGVTVAAAARARGLEVTALLAELREAAQHRSAEALDPRSVTTPELIAHIVAKHHRYLRDTLPFLTALAAKVRRVHGEHNPRLAQVDQALGALAETLFPHLDHEERVLFPALLTSGVNPRTVAEFLGAMATEHLAVGEFLLRIRAASEDFAVPDWACTSYRTLFAELRRLEDDIFTHVHLENNVLTLRFEGSGLNAQTEP